MKNFFKAAKVGLMIMVCALFLGIGIKAEAAPGPVTGLKQTADGQDSGKYVVKMEWTGTADAYVVEYCVKGSNFEGTTYHDGLATSNVCTISGLNGGTSYDVRVSALELDSDGKISAVGTPSAVFEAVTAPSGTVTELKQTKAEAKKITLGWKKVTGANAYEVCYVKTTSSKVSTKLAGDVATYSLPVSANSKYGVALYAARRNSSGSYTAYGANMSDMVVMSTLPPNKKLARVKVVGGKGSSTYTNVVDVSWGSVAAADGYEYQIYGNNNKVVCKGSITATQYKQGMKTYKRISISSGKIAKKAQFMKIRVRAYVKYGKTKKTGKWSDWVWFAKAPSARLASKTEFKVSWGKVTGAKNYDVYVSRSRSSGYKKVATISGTSYTVTNFNGAPISNGIYYYYIVANKKAGKKTIRSDYEYKGVQMYTTYY